jgi:sugar O-acyltransferase (sialic acid O-acetyltransferase NeuD family)
MKKIVLVGAGGHCKVIIDLIRSIGEYEIVGITDKNNVNEKIFSIDIIGDDSKLQEIYDLGVEYAFICVGALENIKFRNKLFDVLKDIGFKLPVLVHRKAVVSEYAKIDEGSCVMAGAIINSGASIGKNCIVNTGSIIEHDCVVKDNSHISPNACLAGGVIIGHNTQIGLSSSVIQNVIIGNNVILGSGAVAIDNIDDDTIATGVPAKVIRYKKENN